MKFFFTALRIHLMRFLRHASTLVCLLLPCLVAVLGLVLPPEQQTTDAITVGVYYADAADTDSLAAALLEELQTYPFSEDSTNASVPIYFVRAAAREDVAENVAAGVWECGYLLPDDFGRRIAESEYRGLIARVASPASSLAPVIDDAVSGALLKISSPYIATSFLGNTGLLEDIPPQQLQSIEAQFFAEDDPLNITVKLINAPAATAGNASILLSTQAFIRGMVALLLLLFASLTLVRFGDDLRSMFFGRMYSYRRFIALFTPPFVCSALLALASGFASLVVGDLFFPGLLHGMGAELVWLLLYQVYLFSLIIFLGSIFYSKYLTLSLTPFLIIACFVFCPIAFDLSSYLPAAGWISLLLPPTLYLRAAAGDALMPWVMGGLSLVLTGIAAVLFHTKNQGSLPSADIEAGM